MKKETAIFPYGKMAAYFLSAVFFSKRPSRPEERNGQRDARAGPGHGVGYAGAEVAPDFTEKNRSSGTH